MCTHCSFTNISNSADLPRWYEGQKTKVNFRRACKRFSIDIDRLCYNRRHKNGHTVKGIIIVKYMHSNGLGVQIVFIIISGKCKFCNIYVTDKSTSTEGIRTTDPQFECPSALPTELKGNSH